MTDMRTWPHEFLTEFIELYRSLSCLYDVKSKQYLNKPLKLAAYDKLIEKLKAVDPEATKDTVVKKINNLRSSYRKELKKMKESKRTGSSGEVYEPSLWYFHLLDFLYDHEIPRKGKSNMQDMDSEADEEERQGSPPAENDLDESLTADVMSQGEGAPIEDLVENVAIPSTSSASTISRKRKSKNISQNQGTAASDQQRAVLKLVAEKLQIQSNNKYSNYVAYVGQELDALPPMMATYCQKLINDTPFEAKCGHLTAQSRIVSGSQTNLTNPQQNFNTLSNVPDYDQSSTWQPPQQLLITLITYRNYIS